MIEMELDEDPGTIARVTPLGIAPVSDALTMAHINTEVGQRLIARILEQRAEIDRWTTAFERVFAENERNQARIEFLDGFIRGKGWSVPNE
jgi:hypothetical protein